MKPNPRPINEPTSAGDCRGWANYGGSSPDIRQSVRMGGRPAGSDKLQLYGDG